jgi:hypothetical protein
VTTVCTRGVFCFTSNVMPTHAGGSCGEALLSAGFFGSGSRSGGGAGSTFGGGAGSTVAAGGGGGAGSTFGATGAGVDAHATITRNNTPRFTAEA